MLINLRNALMTGKRLPYDAEVEYLESTGEQYINTGVLASAALNDAQIDITYSSSSTSGDLYIFGGGATFNTAIQCAINSSSNYFQPSWGQLLAIAGGYAANAVATLRMTYNDYALTFGTTTRTGAFTATSRTFDDRAIYLFRGNRTSGGINTKPVRIYAFKISRNGIPILDLIPVRKGTTGELYDRVSGKFAERHGDFVVGQDVVPVEWLSSDGNQYIDTGYVFQFGDDVSATFQPLATPTQTAYFLGADTAYNAGFNVHYDPSNSSTGLRYCYGGGFGADNTGVIISPAQAFSTSTIYACNGNINKRTINSGENTASVQDSGLNSASVILFCSRRNANVRPASTGWAVASRFFGFGATRNGAGVRAMKPVRVGTDATSWEGAMMDVLTRRIYRNAGTGAFTYGNDLKYPIPAE